MMDPLVSMQEGRYLDAAVIYEQQALAAHTAHDLEQMKGNAVMAVKAYAYAGDAPNALRFAMATASVVPSAEVAAFARRVTKILQDQQLDDGPFAAHVQRMLGSEPQARLPSFCSNCGVAVDPTTVLVPSADTFACRSCGASLAR